jgi:hypothetical protein
MTLALIASIVIALVVFAFVLEPVLRARGDRIIVEGVTLPPAPDVHLDPDAEGLCDPPPLEDLAPVLDRPAARATLDRPAGSDVT